MQYRITPILGAMLLVAMVACSEGSNPLAPEDSLQTSSPILFDVEPQGEPDGDESDGDNNDGPSDLDPETDTDPDTDQEGNDEPDGDN